ncbi:MAG: hypothetical protein WHT09_16255 [Thermogutta sp.]
MKRKHQFWPLLGLLATCGGILLAGPSFGQSGQKVVIPFDFESRFDNGRYGQMVGEMIWQKLHREGGFLIPDSMADVRDFCEMNGIKVGPETPLEKVRDIVKSGFDADIAIWGSVERVPGHSTDVYDLVIKCVDFSTPTPIVIYEKSARTNSVSEIPHLYVQQLLDALYGRQPGSPPPPDPIAEENWKKNPNLIVGGDFERAVNGVPVGWEDRAGQDREPLGRLVAWVPEPGNPRNHVIRFSFDRSVGDTTGVMYYSLPFQVQEGATYRFQCRWRSNGPAVKVFIKCYAEMPSEYRTESPGTGSRNRAAGPGASSATSRANSRTETRTTYPDWSQMRECYRSQQNLKGPLNTWNVHTEDFTPRHTQYTPTWGRVMLYAYLGEGTVEFDDIVIKQIIPPSPGESKKDPRRSLASGVTLKEMEERERASRGDAGQEQAPPGPQRSGKGTR